jgi:hypothetical protein
MSACAKRFWGDGTPCTRPDNTEGSKEMKAKLAEMIAKREAQDERFGFQVEAPRPLEPATQLSNPKLNARRQK